MPHDNNDFVTIASELASTKTLLHLDLSGNSFSAKSLAIIANGLASNHTLLGLHLDNQNHCAVDALAFIHVFGLGGSTPSEEGVDAGIANGNSGITGYSASQGDSGHFALDEATNHVGQPSSGGVRVGASGRHGEREPSLTNQNLSIFFLLDGYRRTWS